jgi:antitoxin component YwqK of YwqJK toxin-antitoxin module
MAADFMAHQVPFRNSFLALVLLFTAGCNHSAVDKGKPLIINSNSPNLIIVNGILNQGKRLFTGTIYTLFPGRKDTAEIAGFLNGRENGIRKRYYPNGHLKEIREFENGNKVGTYQAWWENGRNKLEYHFEKGDYEGTCREWNEEGSLVQEMNYRNGFEEGAQKMFYDNGKVRSNYVIINGRRYGLLGTKNCVNVSDSIFKH